MSKQVGKSDVFTKTKLIELQDKIDKFIQQVDSTNKEYKKMQKLSITLNDVETELKVNREKVEILTENNDALNIKVKSLEKKIDKQADDDIEELDLSKEKDDFER